MTPTLLLALLAQQAAQPAAELVPFPANDPNAVQSQPVELDDSVPLPIPAVVDATARR
jgi:hypothetical protein